MTNAGGNKFDDGLISSLQLATKLEDAMNRIAKETPSPTSYFSSSIQFYSLNKLFWDVDLLVLVKCSYIYFFYVKNW